MGNRNDPLEFIPDIDNDFFIVDRENAPFHNFAIGRGCEVTIIFNKVAVLVRCFVSGEGSEFRFPIGRVIGLRLLTYR